MLNGRRPASRGFAAQRSPAIRRRRPWSVISTSGAAAHYRQTMPRRRPGIVAPPRRETIAARALGSLYLTGAGVVQDNEGVLRAGCASQPKPATRYRRSIWLILFSKARARADDPAKIAGWFKQAAASGDLVAAFNLGICLTKGVGVDQDEQQAAQWLRRAAEGVPDAQYMYGRMLAEGRGVTPDLEGGTHVVHTGR